MTAPQQQQQQLTDIPRTRSPSHLTDAGEGAAAWHLCLEEPPLSFLLHGEVPPTTSSGSELVQSLQLWGPKRSASSGYKVQQKNAPVWGRTIPDPGLLKADLVSAC